MLHDGTENGRAPIFALTAFRFVEDASKAGFEGRTGINFELERRRLKVVTNPLYPPRLNHFQIKALPLRRFIQKDCILLHVSHAATTGATSFGSEGLGDFVFRKDGLNRTFAQTKNLTLCGCDEFSRIKRHTTFLRRAGNHQRHAERAFVAEKLMR